MIHKWKQYWYFGTTFCSIEITSLAGEDLIFSATAKSKNNEFYNLSYSTSHSISELAESLKSVSHCFLTVNTSQVLIKEIPANSNSQNLVSQAFPGISLAEFYYEVVAIEDKFYVAVCRKEYIDSIVNQITKSNIDVIGIHIGFFNLKRLLPFISDSKIQTTRFKLELDNNKLLSIQETTTSFNTTIKEYKVGDDVVSSKFLVTVSGLFNYISSLKTVSSNLEEKNILLAEEQRQKNFFRKVSITGVAVLLFLLIINFLFFESYFKEHQKLSEKIEFSKVEKDNYTTKVGIVESKEQLVNNILSTGTSKSSFYMNRLVTTKPLTVTFNALVYQPLKKSIRPDKKIEYSPEEIIIAGNSSSKLDFSTWITKLESLAWIETVTVINYGISKTGNSEFELRILWK